MMILDFHVISRFDGEALFCRKTSVKVENALPLS